MSDELQLNVNDFYKKKKGFQLLSLINKHSKGVAAEQHSDHGLTGKYGPVTRSASTCSTKIYRSKISNHSIRIFDNIVKIKAKRDSKISYNIIDRTLSKIISLGHFRA
jgi:hypothetical protein